MMSGIYFIVRSDIDECCIGFSDTSERDATLIAKGLYNQKHEIRLLKTYDLVTAQALHHKILLYIHDILRKSPTSKDWYKVSACDIGYLFHMAEKCRDAHLYTVINGKIEELEIVFDDKP